MALPAIVQGVTAVGKKYGPAVIDKASTLLAKATGQKVTSLEAVPAYVGRSVERLSVVTGALARAGVAADDLVPADLAGGNVQLQQVRATLLKTASTMQETYDRGSDHSLNKDVDGDLLRKRRVQTALRVYGSETAYFLCHPNGGIPREDFVWYAALFGRK